VAWVTLGHGGLETSTVGMGVDNCGEGDQPLENNGILEGLGNRFWEKRMSCGVLYNKRQISAGQRRLAEKKKKKGKKKKNQSKNEFKEIAQKAEEGGLVIPNSKANRQKWLLERKGHEGE